MIVDEILTGFHRCKGWFVSCQDGVKPDILVFGKGLGNGHPISGVACADSLYQYLGNALPGSTFAGNGLACAAACGALEFMHQHNFGDKTSSLETLFCEYFSQPRFEPYGIKLDGMGGLLSIGFKDPSFSRMPEIYLDVLKNGVITSHTPHYLRLTPPLTIELHEFQRGLEVIGKCLRASSNLSTCSSVDPKRL
jgi:acetylornithine/succinyldiaminopimelate/putrescine aminotransferase